MATKDHVLVTYQKKYLTGPFAGKVQNAFIRANSRKSARVTAQDLRTAKVDSGEFSQDLFEISKVRVIGINKALIL